MLVLLSPAKKLNTQQKIYNFTKPLYEKNANQLIEILKSYTPSMLEKLMDISSELALVNHNRIQEWDNAPLFGSMFLFNGDVYEGLKTDSFNDDEIEFAQDTIGIISGIYGILRPLDAIKPHRLSMGTKLKNENFKNLYDFWQNTQTEYLNQQNQTIINLASEEYFKVIKRKNLKNNVIDINFEQSKNGTYKNISFFTKYARGLLANFIVKNKIQNIENIKNFDIEGYKFVEKLSSKEKFLFRK